MRTIKRGKPSGFPFFPIESPALGQLLQMRKHFLLVAVLLCSGAPVSPLATQQSQRSSARSPVYISFADAQQITNALVEALPAELKGKSKDEIKAAWPSWVKRYDAEIRARLARGDEDSVVNFLLFGTSFSTTRFY